MNLGKILICRYEGDSVGSKVDRYSYCRRRPCGEDRHAVLSTTMHFDALFPICLFFLQKLVLHGAAVLTFAHQKFIRTLVKTSAMHIFDSGGVVRDIKFLGTRILPSKMKRHTKAQTLGE